MGASRFFPLGTVPLSKVEARTQLLDLVACSPLLFGLERTRWWLKGIQQQVSWLAQASVGALSKILGRLEIVYKRGRTYLHSPDPAYKVKLAMVARAKRLATAHPTRVVLLYQDEFTYYRRPSVAQGWVEQGGDGPRAEQGLSSNKKRRVCGSLDVMSGRVFSWQRAHFDRKTLIKYYQALDQAYPQAEVIYVVQDNWPVHTHQDVIKALADTKIKLIFLPTYAPWTNPIEKVWRKLYAEVLHLHAHKDGWESLQGRVEQWLGKLDQPSDQLLHYVGLFTD